MFSRRSTAIIVTEAILITLGLLIYLQPTSVHAQCGDPGDQPSTCLICHNIQDPISKQGEWHTIHANKDICTNCHGGNARAIDENLAHSNMTAHPLEDIYTDCHACHPDYNERAERFATTLGVTPGSCATPTPLAVSYGPEEPPTHNIGIPDTTLNAPTIQQQGTLLFVSGGILIVAIIVFVMSWMTNHPYRH